MKITREDTGQRGIFKAIEDGHQLGEMTYYWKDDNTFAIDHTGVSPAFEGRGIGKKLVMSAVEYARENNFKIIPICPFVVALFQRDPSLEDIRGTGW